MTEPVLMVEDLHARYGDVHVLQGIDLTVEPAEIMVIMGGSGSGKSTFLRHLLGLELPTQGSVRLLGEDTSCLSETALNRLRRRMGVAFQSGALLSSMSVGENVLLPLREHTRLEEETMRIMMRMKLDVVNLPESEDLMPAQLSGGMVKRAAMARAIIMDPRILFLDEPGAGLDPVVSAGLDELILKLRDAMGMSVVVVTHELDSAFRIADRICVLDRGQRLVCDRVEAVRNSDNERVQALLNRRLEEEEADPEVYLQRLIDRRQQRAGH